MKVAKTQDRPGSPVRLFFDPFAEDIQLYYSRNSTARNEEGSGTKKDEVDDDSSDDDAESLEELDAFRYDKTKYPPSIRQKLVKNAMFGEMNYPPPLRPKLSKSEIMEDVTAIQKGTLGPHRLAQGQTIAACVPYSDDESSGSDSGGGRERIKERWVIAVVVGFDKKKKMYRVKDKYGSEHTSGRGRPRAEVSWEVAPGNVCRFPATRHPKCKPKDRVIALWRTKETDSDVDQSDGDEDWTSVFYDATVVDTEQRVGYMRLDYGGSSGVRTVRVDKVLAIAGRQPRRPEKERNDDTNGVKGKKYKTEKEKQEKAKDLEREKERERKEKEKERKERELEREREKQEKEREKERENQRIQKTAKKNEARRRPFVLGEIRPGPPHVIELLDDSSIRYFEHLLAGKPSLELYEHLLEAIPWKEESVRVTGAAYLESYFTVWFGDQLENPYASSIPPSNANQTMSGIGSPTGNTGLFKMLDPWSIVLKDLKASVEQITGSKFNTVHLTYQDGTDYVGQEEDVTKLTKARHTVATLTLGIDSRVKFAHRTKSHKHDLAVASGSLMVLDGATAENYTHTLPKVRGASGRIVITFKYTEVPDFNAFMDGPPTRKRKWEEEGENPTNTTIPSTPNTPNGPPTPTTPTTPSSAPIPAPNFATPSTPATLSSASTPNFLTPGNANDEEDAGDEEDEGKEEMALSEVQRGDVPGIFPGTKFATRVQLCESGVHRILVGTVCGTEAEGAESILLAGAATDSDIDNGSEVYFTGAVIINGKTRRKSHSSWKVLRGTQALMTSCIRNLPIRVIRSSRLKSAYAPPNGFSFDGLFKVAMYWEEPTKNGHSVWRFKLLGAPPTTHPRLPPLDMNNVEHVHDFVQDKRLDGSRERDKERERELEKMRERERDRERDRERERERERDRERERERERERDRERERERERYEMNGHPSSHRSPGPSSGVPIFLPPPIPLHSHHTLDPSPLHPLTHTLPPPFPLSHVGSRPFMNLPPSPSLDPFFRSSSSSPSLSGSLQQIPSLHSRPPFPPPPPPHHSSFTQFPPPPYLSPHPPPPRLPSFQSSPSHNMSRIWEHDSLPPKQP